MPVVCANGMSPEGEPGNDMIDESYGVILGMPVIDFQGTKARSVVDIRVLASFMPFWFSLHS